ncbi:MAG TPA: AMED_5909 family protein [Pseudonocardiaceae bacterium]|jgi:DNA/RNA-binding domain of Phe-tRNA-synthetase-like protein|nr:AMED_5909 family protein [Pseudonocardiaceae bacterium]
MTPTTSPVIGAGSAVRTLRAAHEWVNRRWPGRDAPDTVWLAYHQEAAAVYEAVAEIDQAHHHEALYWAHDELQAAQRLAGQESTAGQGNP